MLNNINEDYKHCVTLTECILVSSNDIYSSRMARNVLSKMPGKVLCKAGIGKSNVVDHNTSL